ncbi:hypothetical protein [Anaeromyxobacter sp. Fw109-5]|uniref:hypothetical protein n=1 Tax=Anaeromyxobacter sp. (strain Fw109-5) TaxID=404589 RepID=UPI0000ED8207|nr:hypothetical protein [Anaeromyxobacter sp. Fw109-5]ABS26035.1 conserved hypothetical protein [Anaeromyxobacter sp. Fw109-5]
MRARVILRIVCLGGLLALGVPARGGDINLRYAPDYRLQRTRVLRADGVGFDTEGQTLAQRVTLGLSQTFTPTLSWAGDGLFDWDQSWARDADDVWVSSDSRRWTLNTRLELRQDPFQTGVSYARRDALLESTRLGETRTIRAPINDTYASWLQWNPAGLPRLSLNASRGNTYDPGKDEVDRTTDAASLALVYQELEDWDFRYGYLISHGVDRFKDTDALTQAHSARVGWGEDWLDGRVFTAVSYGAGYNSSRLTAGSAGATRETQQRPSTGLSRVEVFPDEPSRVKLDPNPALADADTVVPTQLDLGHARSTARDVAPRDLGAQFPDDRLEVNLIRVWVDRQLPAHVVAGFAWEAWQSDDNLEWTRVPLAGAVSFGVFDNRFEIPIQRTGARYLKVVTRPITTAVTTDPLYASILVTELEFLLVEFLPSGTTQTSGISGDLSGSLRWVILREPSLAYSLAVLTSHRGDPIDIRTAVQQSLGFLRTLGGNARLSAQVSRTDSFDDQGLRSQDGWGASLGADPLPALSWNLSYSGSYAEDTRDLSNTTAASVRADLYEGFSASANGGLAWTSAGTGRQSQSAESSASLNVTPHRAVSANGVITWRYAQGWGGGAPESSERAGRVDGTISVNPFPALYLSASAGRNLFGLAPATTTAVSAGLSLFRGGALALRLNAGQTTDAASRVRNRSTGAGLSVKLGPGRTFDVNSIWSESRAPVERVRSFALTAGLRLVLL